MAENAQNDTLRKSLQELCTLKDHWASNRVEELISILSTRLKRSDTEILQGLLGLELLGYVEITRDTLGNMQNVLIKISEWDSEKRLSPEPAHRPEEKRRFAIFLDYKNLEEGLKDPIERFKDFSWLFNPILEVGEIIFGFVFIPEQLSARPAIMQLFHRHGFSPILCPRQIEGAITKDKDTVDSRMDDLGRVLIEHSDITDLVVVSGDKDFQPLTIFAIWRQKRVKIVSVTKALSREFLKMTFGNLEIKTID